MELYSSHLCALSCTLDSCILINLYRTASVIPLQFLFLSPNWKFLHKNSNLLKYPPSQFMQKDSQLSLDILSELTLALSTSLQKSLWSLQRQFITLKWSVSLSCKSFFWLHSFWGNCRFSLMLQGERTKYCWQRLALKWWNCIWKGVRLHKWIMVTLLKDLKR